MLRIVAHMSGNYNKPFQPRGLSIISPLIRLIYLIWPYNLVYGDTAGSQYGGVDQNKQENKLRINKEYFNVIHYKMEATCTYTKVI